MATDVIRIFSDVHFGDRSSRVRHLAQLRPLLDGIGHLVLNGDTLDTRPGPAPQLAGALRAELTDFFGRETAARTFLTGNHDADISPHHSLDLADGAVFVVHGDVLFDNIVPWSRDVPLIERLIAAELAALPRSAPIDLVQRFAIWRRVAAKIPQRHQAESKRFKHARQLFADTVWPPWRALRVLRAWREAPPRAAALARQHRPRARFVVIGHTHRPGVWRMPDGLVVINSGSFCRPFGGFVTELSPAALHVRRVDCIRDEFRPGETIAKFPL